MKQIITNYIKDESAIDDSVSKMILLVVAISCAMGVGWWIWNTLQSRTAESDCSNSNSPWCME